MGDHTECVEIDFDPDAVSYESLLEAFLGMHNATRSAHSVQYESLILHHNAEQERLARATLARYADSVGRPVATRIAAYSGFTRAEEYHQKYALRGNREFLRIMEEHYPDSSALVDSTAAARLNGYLYGGGSLVQLEREADALGLGETHKQQLIRTVGA